MCTFFLDLACTLCCVSTLQAVLSEQLETALQQTQNSLQATEQMLQETGGVAEQQAQQNAQLQAQVEQVSTCHTLCTHCDSTNVING
jgi:hypothetical protein